MIYQGQEQHFGVETPPNKAGTPANREALWLSKYDTSAPLYKLTATLNKIRKQAIRVDPTYVDYKS